jgi:hypothetical protein
LPDQIGINGVNETLNQGRASATEDHAHDPTGRHLARRHEDPCERYVVGGVTSARTGPVNDNRTSWAHHHVQWMQIEVEETISTTDRGIV